MTAIARPRPRLRLRRLAAVVVALGLAGAGWLYLTLPGVGDAPRRVAAELRAHGEPPPHGALPRRAAIAVVAVEDQRFWHHGALDPRSVGRALVDTVAHPGRDAGGSTLAQQLAKVLYLNGAQGPLATARAIGLAFKLEHRFPKAQILAMYLDSVYFGHGHWGIEAAGEGYFGVPAARLSWGEASLLAGLPQAPSADDPVRHFAAARARQREVLRRLVATGGLSAEKAADAYAHTPRPS